jgi:hypothetical protein
VSSPALGLGSDEGQCGVRRGEGGGCVHVQEGRVQDSPPDARQPQLPIGAEGRGQRERHESSRGDRRAEDHVCVQGPTYTRDFVTM